MWPRTESLRNSKYQPGTASVTSKSVHSKAGVLGFPTHRQRAPYLDFSSSFLKFLDTKENPTFWAKKACVKAQNFEISKIPAISKLNIFTTKRAMHLVDGALESPRTPLSNPYLSWDPITMITVYVRKILVIQWKMADFAYFTTFRGCRKFYRRRNFYQIFENLDFSKYSEQIHFLSCVHRMVLHVDLEPKSFRAKTVPKKRFWKKVQ